MYICQRCGHLDDELDVCTQVHGETCMGDRFTESYVDDACRLCGGDMVEATECKVCGEYYDATDPYNPHWERPVEGICKKCSTFETAVAFGCSNIKQVDINGFFAHLYTTAEINDILLKYTLKNQACTEIDYREYLEDIV